MAKSKSRKHAHNHSHSEHSHDAHEDHKHEHHQPHPHEHHSHTQHHAPHVSPIGPELSKKPTVPGAIVPQSQRDIAVDFATAIHKRFDNLIKATILFGSQAKGTATASSDIDLIIIVDDASVNWDLELVAWYREELGKLVSQKRYAEELHINTIKLTTWWQDLMSGDPVVLNILRYGEALIDIGGFFKPLKALFVQGKINSTPEAVYAALQRAPAHLSRSKFSELNSVEGIYWTMVDSAQAALMTAGQLPPSPEHIPLLLKETFVDKKLLKMELVTWYHYIHALHKGIVHGRITQVKGSEIDLWQERAEIFMKKMTDIIDAIIESNKS